MRTPSRMRISTCRWFAITIPPTQLSAVSRLTARLLLPFRRRAYAGGMLRMALFCLLDDRQHVVVMKRLRYQRHRMVCTERQQDGWRVIAAGAGHAPKGVVLPEPRLLPSAPPVSAGSR